MINGNLNGMKQSLVERLEEIYEIKLSSQEFISYEIAEIMAEVTGEINREISVFISRSGVVLDVSVGDRETVKLPFIRKRRGNASLSGARCIHTHPGGSSMLSGVDISTLLSSRLDAMAAISVKNGQAVSMCVGYIGEKLTEPVVYGAFGIKKIPQRALMAEIENATARVAVQIKLEETCEKQERAMLLGLNAKKSSMDELARLADTAGVSIAAVETQTRRRDNAYYVGKGKAREIGLKCAALDIDCIITNDELSPGENKNLEDMTGVKVIDRTTLILDIFAAHAKTKEGSMQVELAQLKYNLPRLTGQGALLSRLGGGIGTRGPGEKKLEVDRRRLRRRIFELEGEIKELEKQRMLRRSRRDKNRMKEVALVGYTNAGKSSLLNALTNAGVLSKDMLFATLDPITRKLELPGGMQILLTDTVGFIEKLPHDLVSAFKSTLEQVKNADLLLNVVDCADMLAEEKTKVVEDVLCSIGAGDKPTLNVFNKCDILNEVPKNSKENIFVSAKTGMGTGELLRIIEENLSPKLYPFNIVLGYNEGGKLAKINEFGKDIKIDYTKEGMNVSAKLPFEIIRTLKNR